MKSLLSHLSRRGSPALKWHSDTPVFFRQISTVALQSSLEKKLTSQTPNTICDYLSPTPSHLLNISLADFLPESCYPPGFSAEELKLPHLPRVGSASHTSALPQGHHLIYFSPQVPSSKLLPDGTDPLQSPGEPFVRRMWAGGTLLFNNHLRDQPKHDNRRAYCREHIPKVVVKGPEGNEKVFVNIERQIGYSETTPEHEGPSDLGPRTSSSPAIIEMRNIVFMREKSVAAIREDVARPGKTLKRMCYFRPLPCLISTLGLPFLGLIFAAAPHAADFSVPLTPSPSLLFRFSALTFNAHSIHLNPQYCREVEGYRNLLVHGPLTLILMLSVLRSQLKQGEKVRSFDYKNLAPLYAEEQLKICVRKDRAKGSKYEVWIEGKEGGYAVKGSAITEQTHAA
jgi:hydroxyacyl-ACP dehydratase HTD2-like protein with hotdog domain